jgi:hypothetical protein
MNAITPTDDLLSRSFRLAYFILGDRTASMYLAAAAIDKLKIASAAQERRLQYIPTGRSLAPAFRTRISLSRLHLLQRLIYKEAEPFERLLETQGVHAGQHDMIIRFVKHLVMVTTRRNSFYVALGLCRLLHNYTTAETSEIYNLVIQDPDRGRDDDYYRDRKKHLLREFKERFGDSLKLRRGYRGEERFQAEDDSGRYLGLVRECLTRFTPWEAPCVLPAGIDPSRDIAAPLQFKGGDPDEEHEIELNRIHTLLHPDCLERLVQTVGLDPPSRRLEVPRFFAAGDDQGLTEDRLAPRPLSRGEMDALRRHLKANEALRVAASRKLLAVLVDGDERARFEVKGKSGVLINAAEGSEWVEVRSVEPEEEVTLALHAMPDHEGGAFHTQQPLTRGAAYTLSFSAQPADDSPATNGGAIINVSYQEKAAALGPLSSFMKWLVALVSVRVARDRSAAFNVQRLASASALVLLAACAAGLLFYLFSRSAPSVAPSTAKRDEAERQGERDGTSPVPSPTPQAQSQPESAPPRVSPSPKSSVARRSGRSQVMAPTREAERPGWQTSESTEEIETLRGRNARPPSENLLAVRRVYVDPLGGGPEQETIRKALIRQLISTGRFDVVESRGDADAVFEGSVKRMGEGGGGVTLVLRLVNAAGDVIWPASSGKNGATYAGGSEEAAGLAVNDLLAEIRRLEDRR